MIFLSAHMVSKIAAKMADIVGEEKFHYSIWKFSLPFGKIVKGGGGGFREKYFVPLRWNLVRKKSVDFLSIQ